MRSEAMFRRFHTASMPDYCLSGAYLREPSMQCFIPARSDPIRKQSRAIGFEMNRPLVALAAGQPEVEQALDELNRQLHLPRVLPGGGDSELLLVLTSERLELRQNGVAGQGPVFVDFVSGRLAHRRLYGDGRAQPLARAIGLKKAGIHRCWMQLPALGRMLSYSPHWVVNWSCWNALR